MSQEEFVKQLKSMLETDEVHILCPICNCFVPLSHWNYVETGTYSYLIDQNDDENEFVLGEMSDVINVDDSYITHYPVRSGSTCAIGINPENISRCLIVFNGTQKKLLFGKEAEYEYYEDVINAVKSAARKLGLLCDFVEAL